MCVFSYGNGEALVVGGNDIHSYEGIDSRTC